MSNQVSIRKPSKVSLAQERLENAVVWLESAINSKNGSLDEASQTDQIDSLRNEVKLLRQENSALKRVNDKVSTRLGVAIKRLRIVIGD